VNTLFDLSDFGLLSEQSSSKCADSRLRTPLNHRAKFDFISFILGGKISNRTNTREKHTNSNR